MSQHPQLRAQEKRQRFVDAAGRVIHERGYARTSLADVATEARLPSGSLYYYFKTKEAIVAAIVAERLRDLEQRIARWEIDASPKVRLHGLIQVWVDDAELDARYGCPIGSLCYELAKLTPSGENPAAEPLRVLLGWCAEQFAVAGAEPAETHALHLLSALQGISLIANAFQDPEMILRETDQLTRWVDGL